MKTLKKCTVLVNNYNYGKFLGECIRSVLSQSCQPNQILVIDDGSTDDSLRVLESIDDERLLVKTKKNGGQLSCFNYAVKFINDEDVVFLMDSDDLYPPDYIEKAISKFDDGCDVAFFEAQKFSTNTSPLLSCVVSADHDVSIPCSAYLTLQTKCWIGSATSAIALSGVAYKEIFPYFDERRWITRADDIIVYGSSILGMQKKYSPSIGISYRTHQNNNFHGKIITESDLVKRNFALEKLFHAMTNRAGINRDNLPSAAYMEALHIPANLHTRFFIPSIARLKLQKYTSQLASLLFAK